MEFEKKLKELETTVQKLDNKDIALDEGVKFFEEGMNLTKECLKSLSEAKGKVSIIRQELEKLISEPFQD